MSGPFFTKQDILLFLTGNVSVTRFDLSTAAGKGSNFDQEIVIISQSCICRHLSHFSLGHLEFSGPSYISGPFLPSKTTLTVLGLKRFG